MQVSMFQTPLIRPERTAREGFRWAVDQCVVADRAGLAEVFIGEHATQKWESIPNPELVIAAAALLTERVSLGPLAHLIPYHNPASLAIQVGWLQQILEGRYVLGIGAGAYPTDATLRGHQDLSKNFEMMLEGLDIMERVWKREPFFYEGTHFNAGFPEPEPNHPLPDHSPIDGTMRIAVTGLSPSSPSIRFAGSRGYMPCSVYSGDAVLKTHWDSYVEGAESAGRTADRAGYHVVRDVLVADTDAEARRLAVEGGMGHSWANYLLPLYKRFGMLDLLLEEAGTPGAEPDIDFLVDHVWLIGSPDTVAEKLNASFETTGGFGTLLVHAHDYGDDPAPWNESLARIVSEVAPRVGAGAASGAAV